MKHAKHIRFTFVLALFVLLTPLRAFARGVVRDLRLGDIGFASQRHARLANVNSDLNNDGGNPSNDIAPGFRNLRRLPYQFSIDPRVSREIGV